MSLLDVALGVGGVPRGRIIEVYGPGLLENNLGVTYCCRSSESRGYAAYIDAEHAVDPEYSKNLGVDTEELLISQPDTGEQA